MEIKRIEKLHPNAPIQYLIERTAYHLFAISNTLSVRPAPATLPRCTINIMDYNSLMSAIPWKNRLKEQHDPSNKIQDHLYDKIVHKQDVLCKFLYNRFIIKRYDKIPTSQLSWLNEFMNDDFYFQQKTWKEIYMNVYFSSTCNKLRIFQLKLFHRCLPRKRISFNAVVASARWTICPRG